MKTAPLTKRNWIVTCLLAAASVAYLFLVFLPGQSAIRELRAELHQRQQYIVDADRLLCAMEQTRQEMKEAEAYVDQWRESAVDHGALSELFGQMMTQAKDCGVLVTRFDPQPKVAMESIVQAPAVIACEGNYHQVIAFVCALESMPATIWIDEVLLAPASDNATRMRSEVRLRVFADNPEDSN
ncbi:type IV pilus inner membrane component PilO [Lignipirellula cremea]|uniref:Pilus assembly protein, PilO n=1 Tax=Lignipirellula cremea TaxID=2528010 RepID=A0A518DSG2_9BACT|nr:type 4a pilus biogenesis protein PilO [Lignipirellula cremea]QDU94764.1 Pilus assembly protein, PilO [Lignipirellula cremea]